MNKLKITEIALLAVSALISAAKAVLKLIVYINRLRRKTTKAPA